MVPKRKTKLDWLPNKLSEIAEFRYQLRKFLSFSESVSEEVGIPAQQYQLLQVVAAVPAGRDCAISYVAERMLVRHNSAVELVDRAEKSGLVRRIADEKDHRRSLVEVTERGGEVLAQLVAKHLTEIEARGSDIQRTLQKLTGSRAGTNKRSGER